MSSADPDANRIEWLWRISRRVVTHSHQRREFALLLVDVEAHFQALALAPEESESVGTLAAAIAPERDIFGQH